MESLLEQTAPHVSAFERNMTFGRLDAGLVNLDRINKILDQYHLDQYRQEAVS